MSLLRTLHTRATTRTNRFPEGFDRDGERQSRDDFRAFGPSSAKGSLTKSGEGSSEEEPAPKGNQSEVLVTQVCASLRCLSGKTEKQHRLELRREGSVLQIQM